MSDLDTIGRHHAEIVLSSLVDVEAPPIASIETTRRARPDRGLLVAMAVAAVVVTALLPLAFLRNAAEPSDSSLPIPSPTSSQPRTLGPFDLEEFMWLKLDGAFGDAEMRVGMVVLVAEDSQAAVEEVVVSELDELDGYSLVPAEQVAAAATRFSDAHGTERLEGRWVAYGLIPRFADSPLDDWEVTLTLALTETAEIVQVEYRLPTFALPGEWTVLADFPFAIPSGARVTPVGSDLVVVDSGSTRLLRPDGTSIDTGSPPVSIPLYCCGDAQTYAGPGSLILVDESASATWILDVETMTWSESEPRPVMGPSLGSEMIAGELVVVSAAPRGDSAVSRVAAFDLESGTWRELEPVPSPISVGGVTSDQSRLIVGGTHQGPNNNILGDHVVYEYAESTGWSRLPDNPLGGQSSTVAWLEGVGLISWNYSLDSALLDDEGDWHVMGAVPMEPSECHPTSAPTETGLVALCGGIAWFDAGTRQWEPIRSPGPARVTLTQTAIIGLIETGRDQTRMIGYPLPPPR